MKADNQIKLMTIGLIIVVLSPIIGAYILDDDPTKKQDALVYTFIPLGLGAGLMFFAMKDSDEEKAQQNITGVIMDG